MQLPEEELAELAGSFKEVAGHRVKNSVSIGAVHYGMR